MTTLSLTTQEVEVLQDIFVTVAMPSIQSNEFSWKSAALWKKITRAFNRDPRRQGIAPLHFLEVLRKSKSADFCNCSRRSRGRCDCIIPDFPDIDFDEYRTPQIFLGSSSNDDGLKKQREIRDDLNRLHNLSLLGSLDDDLLKSNNAWEIQLSGNSAYMSHHLYFDSDDNKRVGLTQELRRRHGYL